MGGLRHPGLQFTGPPDEGVRGHCSVQRSRHVRNQRGAVRGVPHHVRVVGRVRC